jgi:sterol desaturase/sphingolipid hydroxylase (fatty acid hydroxylase superfamily)
MNVLRFAVRYGYLPVMLVGVNGTGMMLAARGAAEIWLLALIGGTIVLSFAAERILPYAVAWNADHDDTGRDVVHAVVNEVMILAVVATIPVLSALLPSADVWPHRWPFAAQVAAGVVVADAGITLTHLASHRLAPLWRFHAVHHSVDRFYGFNGLMKHPLHQAIEMTAGVAPLLLVGLPVDVASALALAVAVQLLLQHSNADYRAGGLRHFLALNQAHRFHHLKWAGVGDVNFGLFTLLWDHLLGTYSYDPARQFTSADLGMAARPDYPRAYLGQLIEPFRRTGTCTTTPAVTGSARQPARGAAPAIAR